MTIQEFDALISTKNVEDDTKRFRLQWIDKTRTGYSGWDNEYRIHFYYVHISENWKRWSIDYIHLYRNTERIYPVSYSLNSEKETLEISVKLPTIDDWVVMKFPLSELTLLPQPENPENK